MMKKLLFLLIALYSLAGYGQDKTKDYWVYIKAQDEITTTDMITGRSQKGDIVDAIPCSNSEGTPSTPGYFICKMALTAEQRAEMLEPYTEGEGETEETIAYRKNKIDLDTFKTANEIDSKTVVTTDKLSVPTLIEKKESDLSALLQKAQHYERYQLPFIRVAKWFNNLFPQAKASDLVRYVNTASSGGDGTTNNTSGATAAYASLNLCEDAEDGDLTDNGGDTLTINCCGTSADTTTVTFDGWTTDADHNITVIGNITGRQWDDSKYRLDPSYTCIDCRVPYTTIDKLQLRVNIPGTSWRYGVDAGDYVTVSRCIIKNVIGTGYCHFGVYMQSTANQGAWNKIIGNIIYDFIDTSNHYGGGILQYAGCYNNIYIENNTVINCDVNIYTHYNSASLYLYNNLCQDGYNYDYNNYGGDITASADNISSDTSSPNNEWDSTTVLFVDEDEDDFGLNASDTSGAKDGGTTRTGYSDYDIEGDSRPEGTAWDIGADEYVSAGGSILPAQVF